MNPVKLLFIFALFVCHATYAQVDTAFWFVAPDVSAGNNSFDRPIAVRVTNFNSKAVVVSITQPNNYSGTPLPPQLATVIANSTYTFDLTNWISIVETNIHGTPSNNGLYIHSTGSISAYYEVVSSACNCDPEIFVLKGDNALGTSFIIPGQNTLGNDQRYSPNPYSEFDIVATQRNTNVTITPSNNIIGHSANVPFSVKLDSGAVFSCRATNYTASQHLVGSIVTSDKPVAITISDDLVGLRSCADLIGDQLVPINRLGVEYIAVNGNLDSTGDRIFITATENSTLVFVDGAYQGTINKAQTMLAVASGLANYITTSKPAYVFQLTGVGCELGGIALPHVTCTGNRSISFTRSTEEDMFINVIVQAGGQGNFYVNGLAGVIIANDFDPVPATAGRWYAARIPIPKATYPQGTVLKITNTTDLFHVGALNGKNGTGARFGYFGNYATFAVNAATDSIICEKSSMFLFADSVEGASYTWTGPGTFSSNKRNPVIPGTTLLQAGKYVVNANLKGCSASDTVQVKVKPVSTLTYSVNICDDSFMVIGKDTFRTAGTYTRVFRAANGCDSIVAATVTLTHRPDKQDIVANTPVCEGDSLVLRDTTTLANASYTWYGPGNFSITGKDTVLPRIGLGMAGKYVLTTLVANCKRKDSIEIVVKPSPHPKIDIPAIICLGDTIYINVTDSLNSSYSWSGPLGFTSNTSKNSIPNVKLAHSGQYLVTAVANNCAVSDSVLISVTPPPEAPVPYSNSPVCALDTLCLNSDNILSGVNYSWLGPNGYTATTYDACINKVPFNAGGNYILIADRQGCKNTAVINVVIKNTPEPDLSSNSPLLTGQTLYLQYKNMLPGSTYKWTGPNNFSSEEQNPSIENVTIAAAGTYILDAEFEGCSNSSLTLVTIDAKEDTGFLNLYPNPNNGNFIVRGVFRRDENIRIYIYNSISQLVYSEAVLTNNKKIEKQFLLKDRLASGVYMLHATAGGKLITIPFVVDR